MEKYSKQRILENIGKIYDEANECKLEKSFFKKVDPELEYLAGYFGISKNQAFILAVIYSLNYMDDTVDMQDLIRYFHCNPMKILEFSDDFKYLHASGILVMQKSRHRMKLAGNNDQFIINEKITEAILNDKTMPVVKQPDFTEAIDVLEKIHSMINARAEEETRRHTLSYCSTIFE